jgi:hypothetical protein
VKSFPLACVCATAVAVSAAMTTATAHDNRYIIPSWFGFLEYAF